MGVDKEAIDIWKFGGYRADLTTDESVKAPEPIGLSPDEEARRKAEIQKHLDRWAKEFAENMKANRTIYYKGPRYLNAVLTYTPDD